MKWLALGLAVLILGSVLWVLSTYPLAAVVLLILVVVVLAIGLFRPPRTR